VQMKSLKVEVGCCSLNQRCVEGLCAQDHYVVGAAHLVGVGGVNEAVVACWREISH
jgi:hypothetical protein